MFGGQGLIGNDFMIAYFGAFRISEYLISDDELKWLTLANVSFLKSGTMRFVLTRQRIIPQVHFKKFFFRLFLVMCFVR